MDGSTLSSSSNTSSPSSTLRNDGLPPYNRSTAGFRLPSDDELRHEGVEKLIQRLRLCESEYKKSLLVERGRIMKDGNQQLQSHLAEMKGLKEMNRKLAQENESLASEKEELGGMCCFLDDDREKAKKMAREWQVFGRYATGVLSKELSLCHNKIRDLEHKQKILSAENKSLKELRMAFDFEHAGSRTSLDSQGSFHGAIPGLSDVAGTRDSGDGSSSGSTASNYSPDHKSFKSSAPPLLHKENITESRENYIKYLENQLRQLEDAKGRAKKVSSTVSSSTQGTFSMSPAKSDRRMLTQATRHSSNSSPSSSNSHTLPNAPYAVNGATGNPLHVPSPRTPGGDNPMNMAPPRGPSNKQDTIAYAMKVLELQDQMDSSLPNSMYPGAPNDGNHLEEHHKEVIREMCNVVWRKLGDSRGNLRKPQPSRTLQHRTASVSNL